MCRQVEGMGPSSFIRETKATTEPALVSACLGGGVGADRRNEDQSLHASEEQCARVKRKG